MYLLIVTSKPQGQPHHEQALTLLVIEYNTRLSLFRITELLTFAIL